MLKKIFKPKPKYVKFDDQYTTLSAEESALIDVISADIRKEVQSSKGKNKLDYHGRAVHTKGYCALKARFEVLDNLPAEYAQGLYAKPSTHDAVIRFSNAAATVAPDRRLGLAIGLAFKVFDVDGLKLTPDEPNATTMDFALVNAPVFFTSQLKDYAYLSKLAFAFNGYLANGLAGKAKFGFDWLTQYGKEIPQFESFKTLNAFRKLAMVKPKNPWLYEYFSMGAVRHGDYMGKIRVTLTSESIAKINHPDINLLSEDETIRKALITEISEHDLELEVQIQLCRNLKKQPIEDLTQEWKEKEAPFVTVARLTVIRQDVPEDGNFDAMEHLSFTPFRCLEKNRPIGRIQQSRLQAYQASSIERHKGNALKRDEPSSLKQVFDK
ncbi:catalase family protein [Psychrobacter sp.]|uniref:catalase family protein n=1 Tax=Psychrobacter sp. TaxID=56811 RepID=UPI0025F39D08|nr:catalase family protein [Psychrobacter sp.]